MTLGRADHPGGLCRDERLEVHEIEKRGLEQLALDDRALDPHHRLTGEHEVALGNRPDVHMQLEITEIFEESLLEEGSTTWRGD